MRIIKFKYRHTEKAHEEGVKEWVEREKENREKYYDKRGDEDRREGNDKNQTKKRERKAGAFLCMLARSYNCGVKATGREKR